MAFVGHDIGPYIPKVRAALGSIIKACHATYGNALLTSSKTSIGQTYVTSQSIIDAESSFEHSDSRFEWN
jgi:hypothetical protein